MKYHVYNHDFDFGIFEVETTQEARDRAAQQAGYKHEDDMTRNSGYAELVAVPMSLETGEEMKLGQKRTRTAKHLTSLSGEIAAAEAKLKSLREQQKENERRYLEKNQKAILALVVEHDLDSIPIARWQEIAAELKALLEEPLKPVIAEPAKFQEWSSEPEQAAA